MKKNIYLLIICMLICLFLTSCWNRVELNRLAIVMAMGIDKSEKNDTYKITYQVVKPGQVASMKGSSTSGGQDSSPVIIYEETGKTLFEAIRKNTKKIPRKLLFSHMRVIIISKDVAKDGIRSLMDLLERDHEMRDNMRVFVTVDEKASDVVNVLDPLEKIPANAIIQEIEITKMNWAHNTDVQISDVIHSITKEGTGPLIPGIAIKKTNKKTILEINKMGLFRKDKLISWIDGDTARGVSWVNGEVNSTVVTSKCSNKQGNVSFEVLRSKTKNNVNIINGEPQMNVNIYAEANIGELVCNIAVSKPEVIKQLELMLADKIKSEAITAIKSAQSEKSDVFGFDKIIMRKNPKYWKNNKSNWGILFSNAVVSVKVEVFVRRTGLRIDNLEKNYKTSY